MPKQSSAKYWAMLAFVALVSYIFALACADEESTDSNNTDANNTAPSNTTPNNTTPSNTTPNNTTPNNSNNTTPNNSNNSNNSNNLAWVPGQYRISVGSSMTREGPWDFTAEGSGIERFQVENIDGIARYVMIEDLSETGSSKVDSVGAERLGVDMTFAEYPVVSDPADQFGMLGPPNSPCVLPNPAIEFETTFDLGGVNSGRYAIVELFDYVETGDFITVYEVGDCEPATTEDTTGDFITELSTQQADIELDSVDIVATQTFARTWGEDDGFHLSQIYACADEPTYGFFNCTTLRTLGPTVYLMTMELATFVQSNDPRNLRYGLAVNWGGPDTKPPETDWDLYQGANAWYELSWDGEAWAFDAWHMVDGQIAPYADSRLRARVSGETVIFVTSSEEFDGEPRIRFVTMASDGASRGGDVSGANPTGPFVRARR